MTKANYWSARYQEDNTPWDIGYASPPLTHYIDKLTDKSYSILLPGAGNGYEAQYLWKKGFTNLTVIDIASEPIEKLRKTIPGIPKDQLLDQDFFEHQGNYQLILEQTFFCALEPRFREGYVKQMHRLLAPRGKLAGVFFDFPLTESGPPFGGSKEEYLKRFEPYFHIQVLERCTNSIPPRQGSELFFIFEKKQE